MPTARATANTVAQTLFTVPLNMKAKIDGISINNGPGTHGRLDFTLIDAFSQDVSVNNNAVNSRSAQPYSASVPQGVYFVEDVLSLEKIELLGVVTVTASQIDANVPFVIKFHFE